MPLPPETHPYNSSWTGLTWEDSNPTYPVSAERMSQISDQLLGLTRRVGDLVSGAVAASDELIATVYLPSPGTAYKTYNLFTAPIPMRIANVWLCTATSVAVSDTNYWDVRLNRRPGKFGLPPVYQLDGAHGYYSDLILSEPGLLDYYMLNETSGTTTVDAKTPANNATYQVAAASGVRGAPGVTDASLNEFAYALNGTTSAVLTNSYSLPWAAGGSYEAWIFIASQIWDTTNRYTIIGAENTATVPQFEMCGQAGTSLSDATIFNGLGAITPGVFTAVTSKLWPGMEPGKWHHVVYTRSAGTGSGTHKIYCDGLELPLVNDLATTYTTTACVHGIGRRGAASQMFPGRLAHVAFYDRALTATQVANHYNYWYELGHKTTRNRDGEGITAKMGWSFEAFTMNATQALLAAGDTLELELEPFGTATTPGELTATIRYEPL